MNSPLPDLGGEQWTEPIPQEPHRLVADIDASFKQKIPDLPQRQRIPDIHHHRQADNFGRRIEIMECIFNPQRLRRQLSASSRFALTMPSSLLDLMNIDRSVNRAFKQYDFLSRDTQSTTGLTHLKIIPTAAYLFAPARIQG